MPQGAQPASIVILTTAAKLEQEGKIQKNSRSKYQCKYLRPEVSLSNVQNKVSCHISYLHQAIKCGRDSGVPRLRQVQYRNNSYVNTDRFPKFTGTLTIKFTMQYH